MSKFVNIVLLAKFHAEFAGDSTVTSAHLAVALQMKSGKKMSNDNINYKFILAIILPIFSLSMGIYAAITADKNKPNSDTNGLYTSAYIITIFQSVHYLLSSICLPCKLLNDSDSDSNSNSSSAMSIPLLANIYWYVIYCNYDIPDYNTYATVHVIVYSTILGILGLLLIIFCIMGCYNINDDEKINICEDIRADINKINNNNRNNNNYGNINNSNKIKNDAIVIKLPDDN